MHGFDEPDLIYGVDYSASKRDAGRNTWIAECTPGDDELVVDCLADAAHRPACDPDRESTLDYLVRLIKVGADEYRAFGLDFPFGLPADLLVGDDWQEFLEGTAEGEWGMLNGVDSPRSLYDSAKDHVETPEDLFRRTDDDRSGQEPTGFRIKTQTYYGISRLLAEVADVVSVVPMDDPAQDSETVVLETYPAAVFRTLVDGGRVDAYDTGYKRDTRESIERRQTNVRALSEAGVEFGDHRAFAFASDDALDAVAAAYATWQATKSGNPFEVLGTEEDADRFAVEGYIYC